MLSSDKILTAKSFSRNSKSQASSFQDQADPKTRYLIVGKQQRQMERNKVRQIQQSKRKVEQKVHKKQLLNELLRKKKELQQLQKSQSELEVKQSTAVHKARLKKQKDKLKKEQKQIIAQGCVEVQKDRYKNALKRLQKQKKQLNFKHYQAGKLRQAHCKTQQYTRSEAVRISKSMEQKRQEKRKEEQLQHQKRKSQMIYGLKQQGIGKNKINSRSQQVIILPNQNQQQNEAMFRAQQQQAKQKTQYQQKSKMEAENRRKAIERGNSAWAKMQKSRQFDYYCQDVTKTQVRYNLSRIQAGKKNQFTGVKPLTLSQMEMNKKLRGQQEFERQFFKGKKVEKMCQLPTKYTIFQSKMKPIGSPGTASAKENTQLNKYTRYGKQAETRYQIREPNKEKQQHLDSINTSVKANHQRNNSYSESQDSLSAE